MTEEVKTQEPTEQEEQELRTEEVVEIDWESVKSLYEVREQQSRIQDYLAKMLYEHERRKSELLSRIDRTENYIFQEATKIRNDLNISPDVPYELKLPEQPGEKAYFIKKQE